ncbi:MAG: S8 family serine peptidase [Armatimonadetes bacterium]|nr:S8 family serine peptidase [Armatimonadota bacterium]
MLLLAVVTGAWAGPRSFKTVQVGPMRAVRTAHGFQLRPQLAVADRVLVQMAPSIQTYAAGTTLAPVGGRLGRRLGQRTYVVDLPAGSDVLAAAAALRAQPGVLCAEPDALIYPALIPDDPQYSQQYHLPIISAPQAWDVTTGSSEVVIAIVDSGVDLDHPDMAGKIWVNTDEVPNNGLDDDHNGYVDDWRGWDFHDDNNDPNPSPDGEDNDHNGTADEEVNHGTLVAGTAAAVGNDGWGCAGLDWTAKIMALQVFPDDGGTAVSTVIEGINYATDNGADIINLSIGGSYIASFTAPITAAYNAGALVVSAGGNSGDELKDSTSSWESPVCNDGANVFTENHVLGVGATDRNDRITYYSNYDGSSAHFIDIMAPGDTIYGPNAYFPGIPGFNSYFGTNSGTSFSCPMVTGLAAMLKGRSPSASPSDLIAAISGSGDNIDALNPGYAGKMGGGRLNCARALGVALAPSPPQSLTASDTLGDDGGSITLSWVKSPDDGAGSDTVTAYLVQRRQGATGTFSQIASLPPGTTGYDDTGVTDGLDYYYKVRATDGTLTSETSVVGPVQSRNDQAPPVVANVRAADRPDDNGAAIVLSWDAYTAPADFAGFAIYRSGKSFTSTTGMTPLAVLTNGSETSFTDVQVSDGVDYYYAVGARDTAGNEVRALAAYGPVQSYSNTLVNFPAGLYFMAMPAIPEDRDPATLFGLPAGSFPFARWSPDDNLYFYDTGQRPLPEMLSLDLGRGYWVKFSQAVSVSPVGISAPSGDFDIALTPGWHQIGNPFFSTMDFADASVSYGGATMDLTSAHGAEIMAAFAWVYNNTTQNYDLVYPPLGGQTQVVQPWQGIWVLAFKNCVLTLGRPLATQRVATARVTPASAGTTKSQSWQADWTVGLRVTAGAARDSECLIGAAAQQILAPKPPPALDAPVLTLAAPGAQSEGNYAVSLAQSGQTNIIWNVKIANLRPGCEVAVTAPDLSTLPRDAVALLEDLATGRMVYLRTVSRYAFTPGSGETARSFRLTVSPRSASALAVQSVVAQGTRASGAAFSFTLSSAADCTVTITNIAGRTVRTLEEGKLRPAGNNTLLWDGRSSLGTRVPPGMYLLQVNANGPAGENVRAMSTFRLQ